MIYNDSFSLRTRFLRTFSIPAQDIFVVSNNENYWVAISLIFVGLFSANQIKNLFLCIHSVVLRTNKYSSLTLFCFICFEFCNQIGALLFALQKYMCPQASLFGDITSDAALFNNTRVYGTILLLLVMCCVLLGIKFVSRFAAIGLAAVICSVICVYLGVFVASPERSP